MTSLLLIPAINSVFAALDICEGYKDLRRGVETPEWLTVDMVQPLLKVIGEHPVLKPVAPTYTGH